MPIASLANLDVHYVDEGRGDVLLILPDNHLAAAAYEEEIEHLAKEYRVIALDPPGTGGSTRDILYEDEVQLDPWNFRADLACHLMLDLDVRRCHVLGSGFAALSTLHFAGTQAPLHDIEVVTAAADSFLPVLDTRSLHRWLDAREHFNVRRVPLMEHVHGDDWRSVVDADTAVLRTLADRGGYALPEGVLRGIACPVLLTGTLRDPLTPGIAEQYARIGRVIPDATLHLAGRSGHRFGDEHPYMHTAPDSFRHVYRGFLAAMSAT